MTAALLALAACAWWWLKALAIVGTAIYVTPRLAVRVLERIEHRRLRNAPGPLVAYPLPAPDASDEEFEDWGRAVVGLREHVFAETARQIQALPEVSA